MIAKAAPFKKLLEKIVSAQRIAIDTEADSLYSYYDKLCLIQIGLEDDLFLLEPLLKPQTEFDITHFLQALAGKELIFHDGDYDLRLLRKVGQLPEVTVFDTMIAAKLLGEKELGLAALVKKYFEVTLSKASRKANWAERPLSENMREYALNDVRYLSQLADLLRDQLHQHRRISWFEQSCQKMLSSTQEQRFRDPEKRWKISGWSRLSSRGAVLLRELWWWREKEAQQRDRPAFTVLRSHYLLEIAEAAALGKSIPWPKVGNRYINEMEALCHKVINLAEENILALLMPEEKKRNSSTRMNKAQTEEFELLRSHRNKVAADLKLDPTVIASKTMLETFVKDPQTNLLLPWQRELLMNH